MGLMFNPLILDFLLLDVSFFFKNHFLVSLSCHFSGILSIAGLILIKHLASLRIKPCQGVRDAVYQFRVPQIEYHNLDLSNQHRVQLVILLTKVF